MTPHSPRTPQNSGADQTGSAQPGSGTPGPGPFAAGNSGRTAVPRFDPQRPKALRRMAGGISFALCLLGVLAIFGLLSVGLTGWAFLGAIPLLAGIAGIVAVFWQLPRGFRDGPGPRTSRKANRWFWLPAITTALGVGALAMSYFMPDFHPGQDPLLVRNHVMLWVEIGFILLLAASLETGLIALSLWNAPDESEAILRQTDYAQRRHAQDRGERPDHYDSGWVRGS